jgi:signal transduction histidine kinase
VRNTSDILDLSKIEAGQMELNPTDYSVQDLVDTVSSSLRSLAAEKGLELVAGAQADIPVAFGDRQRITQCLMNLAGNALKFTAEGQVEIWVEGQGETLLYQVSDTGIGIPQDQLDNVFAEFRQADSTITQEFGGTGLGLSITKKFVELHEGRIWGRVKWVRVPRFSSRFPCASIRGSKHEAPSYFCLISAVTVVTPSS